MSSIYHSSTTVFLYLYPYCLLLFLERRFFVFVFLFSSFLGHTMCTCVIYHVSFKNTWEEGLFLFASKKAILFIQWMAIVWGNTVTLFMFVFNFTQYMESATV